MEFAALRPSTGRLRTVLVLPLFGWVAAACGGDEFQSGVDASGGSAMSGGAGGRGGAGGGGGGTSGGTAGTAGAGGSSGGAGSGGGGTSSTECECGPGQYCREGTTDCYACNDFGRLKFAAPEELTTLSETAADLRFPRLGTTDSALFYRLGGATTRLWHTNDFNATMGAEVTEELGIESAPLLLAQNLAMPSDASRTFNFVFDRVADGAGRNLVAGTWTEGSFAEVGALAEPGVFEHYSPAVVSEQASGARLFWMRLDLTAGDLRPELVTAPISGLAEPTRVPLQGSSNGSPCELVDDDFTPWASPDGRLLLLSTAGCAEGGPTDIYAVPLAPSGQPVTATLSAGIEGPNDPTANDTDPSFSPDYCSLYFASDRGGSFALYRAHRR